MGHLVTHSGCVTAGLCGCLPKALTPENTDGHMGASMRLMNGLMAMRQVYVDEGSRGQCVLCWFFDVLF